MVISAKRVYLYYFHRHPNLLPFEKPCELDSLTEKIKGTVMQIEKALINDRYRISKVS